MSNPGNTIVLWILLPMVLSIATSFLRRWKKIYHGLSMMIPLLLAVLAVVFSQNLTLNFAGRHIVLSDSMAVFDRTLQITANQLGMVSFLYFLCFAWNLLDPISKESQWFGSLSLSITALWVTVQFLNPFLYAAVVIELITFLSIPLLSPRGSPAKSGIIRYLSAQTLALPLILLSGWMVSGIETSPSAEALVLRGTLLLMLGFVLWLGIFPLHSWLPMLTEESPPWTSSFLLTIMQLSLSFFLLKVLNQYGWLRNLPELVLSLKWIGALCIFSAGVIAAFQTNLKRLPAYFFLAETGYILLSVAFRGIGGLEILRMTLLPRVFGYWVLGFSVSTLQQALDDNTLDFDSLRGLFWRFPLTSVLLFSSLLNLIGAPLFTVFPARRVLWNLLPVDVLPLSILVAIGVLGILILFLRLFSALVHPKQEDSQELTETPKKEGPVLIAAVTFILLAMIVFGIFPDLLDAPFRQLWASFQNLLP